MHIPAYPLDTPSLYVSLILYDLPASSSSSLYSLICHHHHQRQMFNMPFESLPEQSWPYFQFYFVLLISSNLTTSCSSLYFIIISFTSPLLKWHNLKLASIDHFDHHRASTQAKCMLILNFEILSSNKNQNY